MSGILRLHFRFCKQFFAVLNILIQQFFLSIQRKTLLTHTLMGYIIASYGVYPCRVLRRRCDARQRKRENISGEKENTG